MKLLLIIKLSHSSWHLLWSILHLFLLTKGSSLLLVKLLLLLKNWFIIHLRLRMISLLHSLILIIWITHSWHRHTYVLSHTERIHYIRIKWIKKIWLDHLIRHIMIYLIVWLVRTLIIHKKRLHRLVRRLIRIIHIKWCWLLFYFIKLLSAMLRTKSVNINFILRLEKIFDIF